MNFQFCILYIILQLSEASENSEVRRIAMEAANMLIDSGISRALPLLKKEDVPQIVKCVALHATILKRVGSVCGWVR